MKSLSLRLALFFTSAVLGFGAPAVSAPVLLSSSATLLAPEVGERVVLRAVWTEREDGVSVPNVIAPAQFEMSLGGENYTLNVGPVEGSLSKSLTSDYANPDGEVWGRSEQVWGDSRGNFGVMIAKADGSTPWDASDYGFTRGTSRTETPTSLPADYYRFHFVNDVVTRVGVVEKIDSAGHVLASGTYHALRFNDYVTYSEHASVTWFKDGQKLTRHDTWGYGSPDWFDIPSFSASDAGTYTLHVENSKGSLDVSFVVSAPGRRSIAAAPAAGRLLNISTRAAVGTGDNILIGGCVIGGGSAQLLIRAGGPALADLGVSGALSAPSLRVLSAGKEIAQNSGWNTAANHAALATSFSKVGASPWKQDSRDAAVLITVPAGAYTIHVTGADGGTGVALLEIYILTDTGLPGQLVNLSSRGLSGDGDNVMITGFVTEGNSQVLVRGIGPALAEMGVAGVLNSPRLEVYSRSARTDSVGDWATTYDTAQASALFAKVGAFGLKPGASDAMDVLAVAGARTVMVRSATGATGIALAEVYLVQP